MPEPKEPPPLTDKERAVWYAEFERLGREAVRIAIARAQGFSPNSKRELAVLWFREKELETEDRERVQLTYLKWTFAAAPACTLKVGAIIPRFRQPLRRRRPNTGWCAQRYGQAAIEALKRHDDQNSVYRGFHYMLHVAEQLGVKPALLSRLSYEMIGQLHGLSAEAIQAWWTEAEVPRLLSDDGSGRFAPRKRDG